VVRCFDDPNIVHVDGSIDPARDIEVIETELLLKDLETLERRIDRTTRQAKSGDKRLQAELAFCIRLQKHLNDGGAVRSLDVRKEEEGFLKDMFLLSAKPVLYAANVAEADLPEGNTFVDRVREIADAEGARVMVVSADLEAQISELEREERDLFLEDMGLPDSGLDRLIRAAYSLLRLITFFTAGPKESRAWTIADGTKAPGAAGQIHTDFERGFIRAETIKFETYDRLGTEAAAREAGEMRSEGKDYVVADGDVVLFRFNV